MKKPLVSILVLNWNGEDILEENIRSILSTNYRPFEVVVVDNASTDGSLALLRSFPQITIIFEFVSYFRKTFMPKATISVSPTAGENTSP